jgi:hypothetical protein
MKTLEECYALQQRILEADAKEIWKTNNWSKYGLIDETEQGITSRAFYYTKLHNDVYLDYQDHIQRDRDVNMIKLGESVAAVHHRLSLLLKSCILRQLNKHISQLEKTYIQLNQDNPGIAVDL